MIFKALKKLASMLNRASSAKQENVDEKLLDYDRYDFGDDKDIQEALRLFNEGGDDD